MKKNKPKDDPTRVLPGWYGTYGDMITVVMAFFVLLYAMSKVDEDLFERFLVSFNPARAVDTQIASGQAGDIQVDQGTAILPDLMPPPPAGAYGDDDGTGDDGTTGEGGREPEGDAVSDMMNTFRTYMAENIPTDQDDRPYPIEIEEGDDYIRITVGEHSGVFFNPGQARLTPAAVALLDYLGPILASFAAGGHGIIVEGHTDNIPINTAAFPSNWTLSGARASSVVEYLVLNFGIDVQMIAGLGRGEYFPVDTNDTAEGRANNRRVEIKVFTPQTTERGPVGGWFAIPGTR
ncbi:MAG: flagellar motor protein MotB [Defluviitaleaceae bacterium]|nr:flagellar motor protein MotB [Defluviitaleaceae bacterium]